MRNSPGETAFVSHSLILSHPPLQSFVSFRNEIHFGVFHDLDRSRRLFSQKKNEEIQKKEESVDISIMDGPFTEELFTMSNCWGVRPLMIRNAFDNKSGLWPSWEEVAMLSCDEDVESRLITHEPGIETSWDLQLGPFEEEDVQDFVLDNNVSEEDTNKKWTMVVNDVDRFSPPLSDWISDHFHFIPSWRIDDGQISLARSGGGIGPHVDNYDVFLIQMEGVREWQVGKYLCSLEQEREESVPGIDVRILSRWDDKRDDGMVETFQLRPGDMLYLPPRIPHCGTALGSDSDEDGGKCMTLSVGLRAPSASDMVSKIAEHISDSIRGNAAKRYQDNDLLNQKEKVDCQLSDTVKNKAKKLIRDAMDEILENEDTFDRYLGSLLTESKRVRINYPEPLIQEGDDDEWMDSLGVWGNPQTAVQTIMDGNGALYSAEGLAWAYSTSTNSDVHRLFANGNIWELKKSSSSLHIIKTIACHRRITRSLLLATDDSHELTNDQINLLQDLIAKGYLYGDDD